MTSHDKLRIDPRHAAKAAKKATRDILRVGSVTPRHAARHDVITECPTCHHPMTSGDVERGLTGLQRRIFEVVRDAGSAGIDRQTVATSVYIERADGGPEWALNSVSVLISQQINRKLKPFGLMILGTRGRHGIYRLRRL